MHSASSESVIPEQHHLPLQTETVVLVCRLTVNHVQLTSPHHMHADGDIESQGIENNFKSYSIINWVAQCVLPSSCSDSVPPCGHCQRDLRMVTVHVTKF